MINGKGKENNYNSKLIFEGEYLNGERWNGKGKEYNNDAKLVYDGMEKELEKGKNLIMMINLYMKESI